MTRPHHELFQQAAAVFTPEDRLSNVHFLKHFHAASETAKKDLFEHPEFFKSLKLKLNEAINELMEVYNSAGHSCITALTIPSDPEKALKLYADIFFFCKAFETDDDTKLSSELQKLSTEHHNPYAIFFLIELKSKSFDITTCDRAPKTVDEIFKASDEVYTLLDCFEQKCTLYYFTEIKIASDFVMLFEDIEEQDYANHYLQRYVASLILFYKLREKEPHSINNVLNAEDVDSILNDYPSAETLDELIEDVKYCFDDDTWGIVTQRVDTLFQEVNLQSLNDRRDEKITLPDEGLKQASMTA